MNPEIAPLTRIWFLCYADEFYILTRFSCFSFLQGMAFRNAHHAIEYYLKAGLAKHLTLSQMKNLGHDLVKLCNQYGDRVEQLDIDERLIAYINRFDELRYPRTDSFAHVLWAMPYSEFFERFDTDEQQRRVACFYLPDIDEAVYRIRRSITPDMPHGIGEIQKEYLYRDNAFFR